MFTGLIEEVGTVKKSQKEAGGLHLHMHASFAEETRVDQSICVNGVCLTVTGKEENYFEVQCVEETLRKTALGSLGKGDSVNLERSMQLNDGIEGHLVQGHVDRVGTISRVTKEGTDRLYDIEFPEEDEDLIVPRGSIAVDGISLTVASMNQSNRFTVAIIPYTLEHTNLKNKKAGDPVHLEYDMIGKYVIHYLKNRKQLSNPSDNERAL